jgi:hypothetical protein
MTRRHTMTRRRAMKAVAGIPILGSIAELPPSICASAQNRSRSDQGGLAPWTFDDVIAICKGTGADLTVDFSGKPPYWANPI